MILLDWIWLSQVSLQSTISLTPWTCSDDCQSILSHNCKILKHEASRLQIMLSGAFQVLILFFHWKFADFVVHLWEGVCLPLPNTINTDVLPVKCFRNMYQEGRSKKTTLDGWSGHILRLHLNTKILWRIRATNKILPFWWEKYTSEVNLKWK